MRRPNQSSGGAACGRCAVKLIFALYYREEIRGANPLACRARALFWRRYAADDLASEEDARRWAEIYERQAWSATLCPMPWACL